MHKELYFAEQRRVIAELIDRSIILIASDPDAEVLKYGWVCFEPEAHALHYIYVKLTVRSNPQVDFGHIGSRLMEAAYPQFRRRPFFYTHHTEIMKYLKEKWNGIYNPYLLMKGKDDENIKDRTKEEDNVRTAQEGSGRGHINRG